MQITSTLMTLAVLAVGINAAPAPLNINLGAYSPALVVGDGALTFGGEAEAGKGKGGAAGGEGAAAAAAAAAGVGAPGAAQQGIVAGRDTTKRVEKRQSGFDRALTFAEAALTKGPKIQLGNGEGGAGVGIIVDNNPTAAAQPNRAGAAERRK
ncbi:hypothetical protein BDP81DRAFT_454208 [Colletotrichum phormii]|uniref:CSEP0039 effector protein n=1 Tax=Colletotrichum phormii TaxID=359342 RepID=A0AAJ0E9N8_9PEZI|nr:uncharacterized protein BDP81DRAFT_454208 [Colletotrichum phormii]KAK1623761.1 hypothetical protein BDP81DRAFT_454208 [Colletotrichum phormii]